MSTAEGLLGMSGYRCAGEPVNGTDEVQTITVQGSPTGGTYTLKFGDFETAAIAFDATSGAVQTALRALNTIGASGVSVSGSAGGPYTVTFGGNLTKLAVGLIALVNNSLTGGSSPTVDIAETTPGVTATARGAAVGALLIDETTGTKYYNGGTALAPVWG